MVLHSESGGEMSQSADFVRFLSTTRLGISPSTQRTIELALRHGFPMIEPPPTEHLMRCSRSDLVTLAADIEQQGLTFGPALLPVEFRDEEDRFRMGLNELPIVAETWHALRIDAVTTYLVPSSDELTYRANFRRHVERLTACAGVLNDSGVRLGIEYVGPRTEWTARRHPFVHTLAELLELLHAIGRDNVSVHLDSFHWYTAQESAATLSDLRPEQICGVDLNDAVAGITVEEQGDHRRELPGASGVIDLASFLTALQDVGFRGPVAVEPFADSIRSLSDELAVAAASEALDQVLHQAAQRSVEAGG